MDKEIAQFQDDLLASVGQMKAEQAISITQPPVTIDRDILETFRAFGNDWQARLNDALREWLREHAL